jgi:hypothetical protein
MNATMRSAGLACVLILTGLFAGAQETLEKQPKVILLFDVSASMAVMDDVPKRDEDATRQDKVIQFLTSAKKGSSFLEQILDKANVSAYRFGAALDQEGVVHFKKGQAWTKEEWTRWLKPDRKKFNLSHGTSIAHSALQMLHRERDNYLQAVVIFSDGRDQSAAEDIRRFVSEVKVPVFTVAVGSSRPSRRLMIGELRAPEAVNPDDRFVVRVPVRGPALKGAELAINLELQRVRDGSGKALKDGKKYQTAMRKGRLQGDAPQTEIDFDINFKDLRADARDTKDLLEGMWQITARVAQADVVSTPMQVVAQRQKTRILLFAAGPTREYQFLRSLFRREEMEKRAELAIVLQSGDKATPVDGERVLPSFPSKLTADDATDRYDALRSYDVIISIDPDWTALKLDQLKLIEKWVDDHGGGLVLMAGPIHTYHLSRRGGPDLSPITKIYPVVLKDSRLQGLGIDHDATRPYHLDFSKAAKQHSFLNLDETCDDPLEGWQKYFWDGKKLDKEPKRGFHGYYPVEKLRPASTVLASFMGPRDSYINDGKDPQPFIVKMPYGRGSTLFIGSAETWRLRTYKDTYHSRFWTNLTRHMADGVAARKQHGQLILPRSIPAGADLHIDAQLLGKDLVPLSQERKTFARVRNMQDAEARTNLVELKAKPAKGWFAASLKIDEPGEYEFLVPIAGTSAVLSQRLTVRRVGEMDDLRADLGHLQALASDAESQLKKLSEKERKEVRARLSALTDGIRLPSGDRLYFNLHTASVLPAFLEKLPPKQFPVDKSPKTPDKKADPTAKSKKYVEELNKPPDKIKVLLIDGAREKGRLENGDSYFIRNALVSIPRTEITIRHGDELSGAASAKALERDDLATFHCIFLLNVGDVTAKQQSNLEKYVQAGGGVAFFLGPKVDANFYSGRKKEKDKIVYVDDWGLYKNGKGIFPVPIASPFHPADRFLEPEVNETEQLLLRDDLFSSIEKYPIFGPIFPERARSALQDISIKRYFRVPRAEWKFDPRETHELLTLRNDTPAKTYAKRVLLLIDEKLKPLANAVAFKKFRPLLERFERQLVNLVSPFADRSAAYLARALEMMLLDLDDLWKSDDAKVRALHVELVRLRLETRNGDPLVVVKTFGKGRVLAVMTTAGKEWNNWGGGSPGVFTYAPFIYESLLYLTGKEIQDEEPVAADQPLEFRGIDVSFMGRKPLPSEKLGDEMKAFADAYVITPEALLSFKGSIRAGAGIAKAHWTAQAEPVNVEVIPNLGKSAFGGKVKPAQPHEAQMPLSDLAELSRQRALDEFTRLVQGGKGDGPLPTGYPRSYSLRSGLGFDLKKHLPSLKAKENQAQLHYIVRLWLSATSDDRKSGPVTRRDKPLTFLVVSAAELGLLIAGEDGHLRARLVKVSDQARDAQTRLKEQIDRLQRAEVDLQLEAARVGVLAAAVEQVARDVDAVTSDYHRILHELHVNRMQADMIKSMRQGICDPLSGTDTDCRGVVHSLRLLSAGLEADKKELSLANRNLARAALKRFESVPNTLDDILTVQQLRMELHKLKAEGEFIQERHRRDAEWHLKNTKEPKR